MIPIITNQDNKKISQVKSNKEEIYLESRGFCTIGEIKETSESEGFQVKGQLVLAQIADKIAKDKNISKTEAFNLIYPANPDVETEDQRNIWREYPDLIKEMTLMKSGADNMKAIAATIMIKTRVAYPLETSSILSFGAESISTKPLRFPIEENKFISYIMDPFRQYEPWKDLDDRLDIDYNIKTFIKEYDNTKNKKDKKIMKKRLASVMMPSKKQWSSDRSVVEDRKMKNTRSTIL